MAKIFLDLEKLKKPNSGLGQFCLHLSHSITKLIDNKDLGVYIPKKYKSSYPNAEILFWSRLHKYLKINVKTNIWHSLHQEAVYFPKNENIKKVLTIHDLNFLEIYEGTKRTRHLNQLQKLVDSANAVTFISNFTRKVAEKNLSFSSQIVKKVIYNGVAIDSSVRPEKPVFITNYQPFLFTIGIVGEKKNFHTLIEMMKHLPALKLYISGSKKSAYAESIIQLIEKHNLTHQVFLTGEIEEPEKIWMYKNCSAFVFPSKNEGFGLPVVEAMSFGKPLILSNKTSLPEIGGELANYFTSFLPNQMAKEVTASINQHSLTKKTALIERSKLFNWDNAAKQYLELYSEIS